MATIPGTVVWSSKPEGDLQKHRLRERSRFRCVRCEQHKASTMVATRGGDWAQTLCAACYRVLVQVQRAKPKKAATARPDGNPAHQQAPAVDPQASRDRIASEPLGAPADGPAFQPAMRSRQSKTHRTVSQANVPSHEASGPHPKVLWRCHGCGMPRIDSSCPLCDRTLEYSFVRLAKLDDSGLKGLVSELKATLTAVETKLQGRPPANSEPARVEAEPSGRPATKSEPADAGSVIPLAMNRDTLGTALGLISELTARGHELAGLKAVREARASNKLRASHGDKKRRVEFCRSCKKAATVDKAGVCEACLLARGYRRCTDCGVPTQPRSLDNNGKCQKCRGRLQSRSVRAVSGGLPTLGRRR